MRLSRKVFALLLMCFAVQAHSQTEYYGACIKDGQATHGVHADKRFAMNSVMKFPQALYVADYLYQHGIALDATVTVNKADLMADTWSPMLAAFDGEHCFTYAELLAYSLQQSDNNACDLLFQHCGSPAEVSRYLRGLGFRDIHVRKTERKMHQHPACSNKNWATPQGMVLLLDWFARHHNDTPALQYVWVLMAECNTGQSRLPAATPEGAVCVHKTGTGRPSSSALSGKKQHDARADSAGYEDTHPKVKADMADVGLYLFPDGRTISVAVFVTQADNDAIIANIARELLSGK